MFSCQVKDLSYRYPLSKKLALQNINFSCQNGELIAVIGNNGAGKTTLCNTIRRFIPDFYKGELTGSVNIFGQNQQKMTGEELVQQVGYVSQNPFVQISGSRQTVYEEIAFGLENLGYPLEQIRERVTKTISTFHLTDLSSLNPTCLSGGQKQKVALAAAIAMNPDILLLDEPTSQLDPASSRDIFEIINQLKLKGKTIFIAEHKMELIAEYADKVILLDQGKIVFFDTPQKVYTQILEEQIPVNCPAHMQLIYDLITKNKVSMSIQEIPAKRLEVKKLLAKSGVTYETIENIQFKRGF